MSKEDITTQLKNTIIFNGLSNEALADLAQKANKNNTLSTVFLHVSQSTHII